MISLHVSNFFCMFCMMILNHRVCVSLVKFNLNDNALLPDFATFSKTSINRIFINVSFWNFQDFVSIDEIWFPEKRSMMRQKLWIL